MSHGNKKQSAGRPYRGDLGQRPGDGYFVVPDRDDGKTSNFNFASGCKLMVGDVIAGYMIALK